MPERLLEFNRLELERKLSTEEETQKLTKDLKELIQTTFPKHTNLQMDDEHIKSILRWSLTRINKLNDLVSKDMAFLWVMPEVEKDKIEEREIQVIKKLSDDFDKIRMREEDLGKVLRAFAKDKEYPYSKLMKLLRTVLSGLKDGPSVVEMIDILGWENTRHRIDVFLKNAR